MASETTSKRPPKDRFDCLECGLGIASDEDGCCACCGRSVIIVQDDVPLYPPPDTFDEDQISAIGDLLNGKTPEGPLFGTPERVARRLDVMKEMLEALRKAETLIPLLVNRDEYVAGTDCALATIRAAIARATEG